MGESPLVYCKCRALPSKKFHKTPLFAVEIGIFRSALVYNIWIALILLFQCFSKLESSIIKFMSLLEYFTQESDPYTNPQTLGRCGVVPFAGSAGILLGCS